MKEEGKYWAELIKVIVMAKPEPHPFWDHWIWTHPMDTVRFASILLATVLGIIRIIFLLGVK